MTPGATPANYGQPASATAAAGGVAPVSVTQLRIPAAVMRELLAFQEKFAAGKMEEAAKHVEKAIHIYPQLAGLHHNLGLCFARLGQYDKAIAEFQSATELDGRLVQPRVSLAETYLIQGKYNEGEAAARAALQIDPMNTLARYFVARNMILAGHDTAEAMELLRKSREAIPEARLALANAYARQHAKEDAVRELREYLEQPNVPEKDKAACAIEKLTKPEGNFNCTTK
jgi:tetratricopeptide (TPR) repeat protein